jgi:catecholate siderophore receptor
MLPGSSNAQDRAGSNEEDRIELPEYEVNEESRVVESTKFTQPLRDIPMTVEVIPSIVIEQQGASSLRDVLRNTPGITFQAGEGGGAPGDNLYIRGFSARTDIFTDGVRDSGDFSRDAFNVEQVEVIKGPASTNTGRGSTGGSVNLITKKPGQSPFINSNLRAGTADQYRGTLDVNQPVDDSGNTAVRLNLMAQDSGVPGRDEVYNRSWGVAPAFSYGLNSDTTATVRYQHLEQDNLPDFGLMSPATSDPDIDWSNYYGLKARDFEEIQSDSLSLEIEHEINENLSLRNFSRWGENSRRASVTSPRVGRDDPTLTRDDNKRQDRENEILANQTDLYAEFGNDNLRHSIVAGLELASETYTNYGTESTGPAYITDLYNPTPNAEWEGEIRRTGTFDEGTGDTIALYAFDTLSIGDHWEVSGGVRLEKFDAEVKDETGDTLTSDETMTSWRAAAVYKPTENGSIYASTGVSYNPSAEALTLRLTGRGGVPSASTNPTLDTEKNQTYEVGTKWDLFDGHLFVSGALFRTVKTNSYELNDAEVLVPAGDRTVDGVELGVSGFITPRWFVYGGYAHMENEAKSGTGGEDESLSYVPGDSFNLWSTFAITNELTIGGGAQYAGGYYYSSTNEAPDQASYWLFNAMISYEVNTNLTLRLNIDNVADEQYVERGYSAHFTPGPTRSATLTAELRF